MTNRTAEGRFWEKVQKTDTCWIWAGARLDNGRGVFRTASGRNTPAHHFSFEQAGNAIPPKTRVLHLCDNRSCVNPGHLFLGTPANILRVRSRPGPNGCIEWTGAIMTGGYGLLGTGGRKHVAAHRVAYEVRFGPIPDGLCVLHSCDNRLCINPDHLFLGTKGENNADRHEKGRTASGEIIAMWIRGELNVHARLTSADIREIRGLVRRGMKQIEIARAYGVHPSHISRIASKDAWRHIS